MNCRMDIYFPSFTFNLNTGCANFCTQLYRSCRATDKHFSVFYTELRECVGIRGLCNFSWKLSNCALDQKQG